jgi:hypothetical protein
MKQAMDIDDFFAGVNRLADELDLHTGDPTLLLNSQKGNGGLADDCAAFRESFLTQAEIDKATPFFEFGFFNDSSPLRRAAWFTLCNEIMRAMERRGLQRACERYNPDQALFRGAPNLINAIRRRNDTGSPDNELIAETAVSRIGKSEVYRAGNGFTQLSPHLSPAIPQWAEEAFGTVPRYVRLNPHRYFATEPLQNLTEAAIAPANPRWMSTVALFTTQKDYAAYVLEDCSPKDNKAQSWDFRVRHIRRLEVSAQRRNTNYLTMMIEELPRSDDPSGLMVARCIHLDTQAMYGTPMNSVQLQHLDLAINVYLDEHRDLRVMDSLQHGRVVDATFRTHLFRIEDIPFPALFGFAERFLRSRTLLREWLTDALGAEFGANVATY